MTETSTIIQNEDQEKLHLLQEKYGTSKTPAEEELISFIGTNGVSYRYLIVLYICTLYCLIVSQVLIFEVVRLQPSCQAQIFRNRPWGNITEYLPKDYYIIGIVADILPMRYIGNSPLQSKSFCQEMKKHHDYSLCFVYSMMVSPFVVGILADIYGRKMLLHVVSVVSIFGQLLLILPWRWLAIPSALVSSPLAAGNQFLAFLLLIEISSDKISHCIFILFIYVPFSGVIVYGIRYYLQHAAHMILCNIALIAISLLAVWYFTESPRWLVLAGYHEEAWLAVKRYNQQATQNVVDPGPPKTTKQLVRNMLKVFKTPIYCQRLIFVLVSTACTAVTSSFILQHYKITYLSTIELNAIKSIAEVLAFIPIVLATVRYGKKNVTCVLLLFETLLHCLLLMRHEHMTKGTVAVIIMIAISAVHRNLILTYRFYIVELFPTLQRCTALGLIVAEFFIAHILQWHIHSPKHYSGSLASVPVLVSSVICILFMSFLPNERTRVLPDTALEGLYLGTYF